MHHFQRRAVDAVRQRAGVGDQRPWCTHTEGALPCADCLLGGES